MDATQEHWLPVVDWEGFYEVSDQGRVRSVPRLITKCDGRTQPVLGRILKLASNRQGYPIISLQAGSRKSTKPVHRLVLTAFVGPKPDGTECCHGDGDKTNNRLDNLRWDSKKANALDAVRHGTRPDPDRTHCQRGHDLSTTRYLNTYGDQCCRECTRLAVQRWQEKVKAQRRANPKPRKPRKRRTPKTHCKRGHEFTPENTYDYARGRQCRACAIAYAAQRYNQSKE